MVRIPVKIAPTWILRKLGFVLFHSRSRTERWSGVSLGGLLTRKRLLKAVGRRHGGMRLAYCSTMLHQTKTDDTPFRYGKSWRLPDFHPSLLSLQPSSPFFDLQAATAY